MSNLRRIPLPYDPLICPDCGELIIVVGISVHKGAMRVVPQHPDRVTPYIDCVASTRVIKDGVILPD